MKIIFLDVDGVLNTEKSRSRCGNYIGIDNDKLLRVKRIVIETGAKIVLVSTWKQNWERLQGRKIYRDKSADYLDRKFRKIGLTVYDKTSDWVEGKYLSRGEGVLEYIYRKRIKTFAIIDDYQFDYDGCGLTDCYVKINNKIGITDENVQQAMGILNGGV